MNLILKIEQFHIYYLIFMNVKNNMVIDGKFTKLIYSNHHIILNGLYIDMHIMSSKNCIQSSNSFSNNPKSHFTENKLTENDFSFQKIKHTFYFPTEENSKMIHDFEMLEKQILHSFSKHNNTNKEKICSLYQQLSNGYIKYYIEKQPSSSLMRPNENNTQRFYLKISGIWETSTEIGLTYKIIEYHHETV